MPGSFRSRACAKTPQTCRDLRDKRKPMRDLEEGGASAPLFNSMYKQRTDNTNMNSSMV